MKKILFMLTILLSMSAYAQEGQIYSIHRNCENFCGECNVGYSFRLTGFDGASICYVVDDGTLPVNVIENISEYCGDTIIMCIDTSILTTFSVFLESTKYGITIKQWICVYPEGNSNTLILNNFDGDWNRYIISDTNGRIISRGRVKKKNMTMVNLKEAYDMEYYIEFISTDGSVMCLKEFTMNWI